MPSRVLAGNRFSTRDETAVMNIYTKQRRHSNGVSAMVQRTELPGEWTTWDASIEETSQTGAISGSTIGQFSDDGRPRPERTRPRIRRAPVHRRAARGRTTSRPGRLRYPEAANRCHDRPDHPETLTP